MYDWLNDSLRDSATVVTANRRLARVLKDAHANQQINDGKLAWSSPDIIAWPDWLGRLYDLLGSDRDLPVRLRDIQSRILWEQCLGLEVSDPLLNISALARQAQEAWTRLNDWCVSLEECVAAAAGRDQKIFAAAATAYQSQLQDRDWIDNAGLAGTIAALLSKNNIPVGAPVALVGFDRYAPIVEKLVRALESHDVSVERREPGPQKTMGKIVSFENADAELRAAGAWAREQTPAGQRVAIVCTHLERDADRVQRLVREGLAPGWQTAGSRYRDAVNVSYGRRMIGYPLVAVALEVMQWCVHDISSQRLSGLLRSWAVGHNPGTGRSKLELMLRQAPDRHWSPSMALHWMSATAESAADAEDFLKRVQIIDDARANLKRRATPAEWATTIDDLLKKLHWPGDATLTSREYQLVNRWRELLNDFARLEIVLPTLPLSHALTRLRALASETVFQPESENAIVQLLGPLEAAGMQFDALWIAGMTADHWPPSGRPSPLLSRTLQRDHAMPDADPANTLAYAERVVTRLAASTTTLVCSYARSDGDAEQSASELLYNVATASANQANDPGWYAASLAGQALPEFVNDDPVPVVGTEEKVSGGAATIERQFSEPFSAFAYGRLGIRPVYPIPKGLPASLRGSLIHGALNHLYRGFERQVDIESLSGRQAEELVSYALNNVLGRVEALADDVLRELLRLERRRIHKLLLAVLAVDQERETFDIVELEGAHEATICGIPFALRIDRVDATASGEVQILDYKTGQARKFLDSYHEPYDMQLVVYAKALDQPVSDLAYVNIDSRDVFLDGAGKTLTPDLDWDELLHQWSAQIDAAVAEFAAGDVRLRIPTGANSGRSLRLLSRIRELSQ